MYAADVTNAAEVERMVETALQRYGRLDILHNNVGGGTYGCITEVSKAGKQANGAQRYQCQNVRCERRIFLLQY